MSSAEEEHNEREQGGVSGSSASTKKRKIQRACDKCRRKKIRCDGGQMQGNRCSNCITYNFQCTYVEAAKKRGPPKGYVESLENRIEGLEALLKKYCPDVDLNQELVTHLDGDWPSEVTRTGFAPQTTQTAPVLLRTSTASEIETEDLPPSEDEFEPETLIESLRNISLNPKHHRFYGKSSGINLIQTALDLKNEFIGREEGLKAAVSRSQRTEFWAVRPWEILAENERRAYVFPDDDLLSSLVHLYFNYVNPFSPLLHRPTFERLLADGLHKRDEGFGATVLLVCAVASRYSDDPRVFLEGSDSTHTSGWKWFRQVQVVRKSLLASPSLYDMQFYCLSVLFMQGSSAPQACWTVVGIGIRLAQDVGAHRKKVYHRTLTVEDELWKRAFWVLVCTDRLLSAGLGRPCAIHDEDFDLDLPVECDDEYWEHPDPEQAFKQPPDKPSVIAQYISYIKLTQILAFALRTIYSINKSKVLLGFVGSQWEQHIVSELDSALNKWIDSVPDHLRWDPQREDILFFNQSVLLHAWYYNIQILIHRPFIPSPRKPSPLSFPSLAICANAARSCSHVIDIQRRRNAKPFPLIIGPAFTASLVLLLTIWGGKRSGLSTNPAKEMADVNKCMDAIRNCEERWHPAGRLIDILVELAHVGELPLPQPSTTSTQKREREEESPFFTASNSPETSTMSSPSIDTPRSIAGTRRVTPQEPLQPPVGQVQQQPSPPGPSHVDLGAISLPMYSVELGRLPVHTQVPYVVQPESSTADGSWYSPQAVPMPPAGSGLPPFGPTGAMGSSAHNGLGDGTSGYSMDQLFFGQMATFADTFTGLEFPTMAGQQQPPYEPIGNMRGTSMPVPTAPVPGSDPLGQRSSAASQRSGVPFLDEGIMGVWSNLQGRFDGWGL